MMLRTLLRNLIGCDEYKNEAAELHVRTLQEIEKTTAKLNEMNEILMKTTTAYKIYKATGRVKRV